MALKLTTTELHSAILYKNGVAKRRLPDIFLTKGEANIYAKEYLRLRRKKNLSIRIMSQQVTLDGFT